jgi:hypothetical protein
MAPAKKEAWRTTTQYNSVAQQREYLVRFVVRLRPLVPPAAFAAAARNTPGFASVAATMLAADPLLFGAKLEAPPPGAAGPAGAAAVPLSRRATVVAVSPLRGGASPTRRVLSMPFRPSASPARTPRGGPRHPPHSSARRDPAATSPLTRRRLASPTESPRRAASPAKEVQRPLWRGPRSPESRPSSNAVAASNPNTWPLMSPAPEAKSRKTMDDEEWRERIPARFSGSIPAERTVHQSPTRQLDDASPRSRRIMASLVEAARLEHAAHMMAASQSPARRRQPRAVTPTATAKDRGAENASGVSGVSSVRGATAAARRSSSAQRRAPSVYDSLPSPRQNKTPTRRDGAEAPRAAMPWDAMRHSAADASAAGRLFDDQGAQPHGAPWCGPFYSCVDGGTGLPTPGRNMAHRAMMRKL